MKSPILCEESLGLYEKKTGHFFMYVCPLQPMPNPEWKDEVDLLFDDGMGYTAEATVEWSESTDPNDKAYEIKAGNEIRALVYSEQQLEGYKADQLGELFNGYLVSNVNWNCVIYY